MNTKQKLSFLSFNKSLSKEPITRTGEMAQGGRSLGPGGRSLGLVVRSLGPVGGGAWDQWGGAWALLKKQED